MKTHIHIHIYYKYTYHVHVCQVNLCVEHCLKTCVLAGVYCRKESILHTCYVTGPYKFYIFSFTPKSEKLSLAPRPHVVRTRTIDAPCPICQVEKVRVWEKKAG